MTKKMEIVDWKTLLDDCVPLLDDSSDMDSRRIAP